MNLKDILKQFEDRIIQLEQDNQELFDRIADLEEEVFDDDNGQEAFEEDEGEATVTLRIIKD